MHASMLLLSHCLLALWLAMLMDYFAWPCLHKHVFDLKCNCLDTFYLLFTLKHPKTNMYTKTHFKVNTHINAFTNTLVHLCINGTDTLMVFVEWEFSYMPQKCSVFIVYI